MSQWAIDVTKASPFSANNLSNASKEGGGTASHAESQNHITYGNTCNKLEKGQMLLDIDTFGALGDEG